MAIDEFKESGVGYSLTAEHTAYKSQIIASIDDQIAQIVQDFALSHPIAEIKADFQSRTNLWLSCKNIRPPTELQQQGTNLYRSCQLMVCL